MHGYNAAEFSPWGRVVSFSTPGSYDYSDAVGPNQTSNGIGIYKFASPKVSSGLNTGSWSPVGCVLQVLVAKVFCPEHSSFHPEQFVTPISDLPEPLPSPRAANDEYLNFLE